MDDYGLMEEPRCSKCGSEDTESMDEEKRTAYCFECARMFRYSDAEHLRCLHITTKG